MIFKIKQWCESLVIAIIISIIIEIMIPEGNNKKYVKVIIGIYILFIMISPILELYNEDYNIDLFSQYSYIETDVSLDANIKEVYIEGIEQSIKSDFESKGLKVEFVKVYVDSSFENIEKIIINFGEMPNNISDIYNYFYDNYSLEEQYIELRGV